MTIVKYIQINGSNMTEICARFCGGDWSPLVIGPERRRREMCTMTSFVFSIDKVDTQR